MTVSEYNHKVVYTTKNMLNDVPITDGYIIFCRDEQTVYFDFNNMRQRYDKFILLDTDSERSIITGINNSFYFCKDTRILWFFSYGWYRITLQASDIIDTTLTISGKAADAKVVGDQLAELLAEFRGKTISWEEIQNKPFYNEIIENEIINISEVTMTESDINVENLFVGTGSYDQPISLVEDKLFFIESSIGKYLVNAIIQDEKMIMGNAHYYNQDNEDDMIPFCFVIDSEGNFTFYLQNSENTENIVVKEIENDLKCIDEIFIPSTIARSIDVENRYNELEEKLDKVKSEIPVVDLSGYETQENATNKLNEAKEYADNAANTVKNELLHGAGAEYDTLHELGDLIDENTDAIDALKIVATSKASQYDLTAEVTRATLAEEALQNTLEGKASKTNLDNHVDDTTKHITSTERTDWNKAYTHSQATHARTDATKVADSSTNGNILINGEETNVYTHPSHTAKTSGLYKITVDGSGHVSSASEVSKSDITALGIPSSDTTYNTGTESTAGLTKLYTGTGVNTDGTMTQSAIKSALDGKSDSGHTHSSYVNQNAFSNVKVGDTTVAADTTTDTLTLVAGSNVTITPDSTNDKITISATDTTYSVATQSANGLMSSTDKTKLDGIAEGANKYTLPVATSSALGGVKSGGDVTINTEGVISVNDDSHNHTISNVDNLQSTLDGKVPTSRTINGKALSANITLSAGDIDADPAGSAESALAAAKQHTNTSIANLIGSADETMNTLGEIQTAMKENADVVEALDAAIGSKANTTDLTSHTGNTTVHTNATERSNWNTAYTHSQTTHARTDATKVADSSTNGNILINGEETNVYTHPSHTAITGKPTANATPGFGGTFTVSQITSNSSGHVTGATDRTITIPNTTATQSTAGLMSSTDKTKLDGIATGANKYTLPVATSSALGGVKSGGDITVDSSGNVTINDDSHEHSISNIRNLADVLNNLNGYKMDKENPTGTGSFSLNRSEYGTIGDYSFAAGLSTTASGTVAHAEGWGTSAYGEGAHAEGSITEAFGEFSHVEGCATIASSKYQHVQGTYNIEDSDDVYAHIVGNGYSETIADDDGLHTTDYRSNAHTLDWSGNAWYAGDIRVGGTSYDDADKLLSQNELLETVEVTKYVDTLRWDGDTTGRPMVSLMTNPPFGLYFISSVLPLDIIQNTYKFSINYINENGVTVEVYNLPVSPHINQSTNTIQAIQITDSSSSMFVIIALIDNYDSGNGVILPYKGVYFTKVDMGSASRFVTSFTISNYPWIPGTSIEDKLKQDYLPPSVLTKANFVLDGTTLIITTN